MIYNTLIEVEKALASFQKIENFINKVIEHEKSMLKLIKTSNKTLEIEEIEGRIDGLQISLIETKRQRDYLIN